jgi:hypothetical protein
MCYVLYFVVTGILTNQNRHALHNIIDHRPGGEERKRKNYVSNEKQFPALIKE